MLKLAAHRFAVLVTSRAAMPPKGRKRQLESTVRDRLPAVLHRGAVSAAGLAQIIKQLGIADVTEERLRHILTQENREAVRGMWRILRVPSITPGRTHDFRFLDPAMYLASLLEGSPALQGLYGRAWDRCPSSPERPWTMVVAFDEFIPGNKLAFVQARKSMVVSFTFLELDSAHLSNGRVWCTPLVIRSTLIHEVGNSSPN